jgi:hypothetical protein
MTEREKTIKLKQVSLYKHKYAYDKVVDKWSDKGRYLRNKIEQLTMELAGMYSR